MATIVRTEKRQRSAFGKLIKWTFIAFNVLMIIWLVSGMSAVSQLTPDSEAARAGHAIGATIGFSIILGIWMMGVVILGLFVLLTRGDKVVVEETSDAAHVTSSFGQQSNSGLTDPDEMIARYKAQQQSAPRTLSSSAAPSSGGAFGRRR